MYCERVTHSFSEKVPSGKGCILDTIRRIDELQRESVKEKESDCIGCGGPLIAKIFDTKPVAFTLCCDETFSAYLGLSNEKTDLFRIEKVMPDCVLLRLLCRESGAIRCTKHTVILRLDCICAIQCFEPINCHLGKKDLCNFED